MSRLTLAVVLIAAAACGPVAARQAAGGGVFISAKELAARAKDADLVLLHVVLRVADYEQAHIPGARPLAYRDIAVEGEAGLGSELPPPTDLKRVLEAAGVADGSRVVLYGNTVAAARAFFTLDVAGHRRVAVLDGGLAAWKAEGGAVESGAAPTPARAGSFTPRIDPARLATADWIAANAGRFALVDVRPDPEYTGSDGGMGAHAPGHIEGARQLPWDTLVDANGRFLPEEQLRAKLTAAGAAPGKAVVPYCMVGMRASVVYLVARHLGFDARLYDGSIVDWTQRKLPTRTGR
jgi:thiosulfate/3-mercaptopyruvate sulfurtransferase